MTWNPSQVIETNALAPDPYLAQHFVEHEAVSTTARHGWATPRKRPRRVYKKLAARGFAQHCNGPTPDFMEPPEGFVSLASDDGQRSIALAPARDYLTSRGVTAEMIERTGLGACASGKYAGRIVFHVITRDAALIERLTSAIRENQQRLDYLAQPVPDPLPACPHCNPNATPPTECGRH